MGPADRYSRSEVQSVRLVRNPDRPDRRYPRRAEIARAVAAARDMGIAVTGLEISPDGRIRVTSGKPDFQATSSEFDRWDAAGRL